MRVSTFRSAGENVWQRTSILDEGDVDHETIIGRFEVVNDVVVVRVAQLQVYDLRADPVRVVTHPARMTFGGAYEMDDVKAELIAQSMLEGVRFMRNLPAITRDVRERILVPRDPSTG
jgi:hypothetical protein